MTGIQEMLVSGFEPGWFDLGSKRVLMIGEVGCLVRLSVLSDRVTKLRMSDELKLDSTDVQVSRSSLKIYTSHKNTLQSFTQELESFQCFHKGSIHPRYDQCLSRMQFTKLES